jgi:anti-anti-sigma factor
MLGTHPDIASARKLHQRLCKCAAKNTDVNLYADKVETIDTIALQLLLSFIRQVRDNGNQVNWKSPSAALMKTAALTGLQGELSLPESSD